MRFDTHVHLWRPGDGHRVLIRERIPALDADYSLAAVRRTLAEADVARIILVSAAQEESETAGLLAAAGEAPGLVAGVVGWLDLQAPDLDARIERCAAEPAWLGVRLPLTVMADREFIGGAGAAIAALAEAGALLELLAAPDQLDLAASVLAEHPQAVVVVDHAGNPDMSAAPTPEWQAGLARLARLPNAWCKVSAFWAPGDPPPSVARAEPFFAHALAVFGAGRLVAAANWPVSALAGPYAAPWTRLEALAGRTGLSQAEWAGLAHDNAERMTAAVRARRAGTQREEALEWQP